MNVALKIAILYSFSLVMAIMVYIGYFFPSINETSQKQEKLHGKNIIGADIKVSIRIKKDGYVLLTDNCHLTLEFVKLIARIIISLFVLAPALYVVLSGSYPAETTNWACIVIGTVIVYWLR